MTHDHVGSVFKIMHGVDRSSGRSRRRATEYLRSGCGFERARRRRMIIMRVGDENGCDGLRVKSGKQRGDVLFVGRPWINEHHLALP